MEGFHLNRNTKITTEFREISEPVRRAISRFQRDIKMTMTYSTAKNQICLQKEENGFSVPESYRIYAKSSDCCETLVIESADDLGFIYALIHISEVFLGILPFWFWNDQKFIQKTEVIIPARPYDSVPRPIRFRGWFINDEVLISHWNAGKAPEYPWEMAMEALLRCGGNLVIPGTDKNAKRYASLASDMGLWVTHHHAEPLGAEMFLRAYPDKEPSFQLYPDLFRKLWTEGILRQKGRNIIWNLGFRGQGDIPFWEHDNSCDTPEKRGALISRIIQEQYDLVKQHVENPCFCTNLYGETMELYQQGHIHIPEDVITIWADNGYGKMVSRRQGNHNPRVPALPALSKADDPGRHTGRHGIYYHVSFYDLQAANVLTTAPNSTEFMEQELRNACSHGIRDMWLINCSNIKPHVYPLDFLAALWNNWNEEASIHRKYYLHRYYPGYDTAALERCVNGYVQAMLPYGRREDEHAGEQFYHYVTRIILSYWMQTGGIGSCQNLFWFAPDAEFSEQVKQFAGLCRNGLPAFHKLLENCMAAASTDASETLWQDSFLLQVQIHTYSAEGAALIGTAFEACLQKDYLHAFCLLGQAAEHFDLAQQAMMKCCHDKWLGFYDNDCQTDIGQTVYLTKQMMGYVRNLGDGPFFYHWQRQIVDTDEDRGIFLLTNEEKHMTDETLYQKIKEKNIDPNV